MAGPARIFELYTLVELAAALATAKEDLANGTITATSGAQKSSSMDVMPASERLRAITLEYRMRGLISPRPQKVEQIIERQYAPPAYGYDY